ncbi:MAG: hypothetical protein AAF555_12205 [Verrucomicrobiota bacterium]
MMPRFVCAVCLLALAQMVSVRAEEVSGPSKMVQEMEEVGGAYKFLRRALRYQEVDFAATLGWCQDGLKYSKNCVDLVPAMVAAMPEGEVKAAALASYRKQMEELLAIWEKAILASQNEDRAALEALVTQLGQSRKTGHQEFIPGE